MPKNEKKNESRMYTDDEVEQILERLRIAVPRITTLAVENEVAIIAVPPFQALPNDSLRQRSIAQETGLSGAELATVNYLLATDEKILKITGGVELTLKTQRV